MANKENTNKKALKSGVWYTLSNFIVKASGFITMPIFTRLLTKAEVGSFSNIQSWFSIISIIVTFDIYASVMVARFDYKDELDDYISSTLVLGTTLTAIFYAIVLVFRDFFMELFAMDFLTLNLIFTYCLVYPALQMFQMKSRIFYKYKTSVAFSLSSVLLSVGGSLMMVLLCSDKLFGRTVGFYIPLIVLNLCIYIYLLASSKKISTKYFKYALVISFPLIWHTLAGHMLNSSSKILITKICGAEYNALYSVAYSCAIVVSVLWNSMNTAWSPWAYEKMDEQDYGMLKKASRPYMLFFGAVVFCFIIIAPEMLRFMAGGGYVEAVVIIPPIMIGYVFQFVYSLYVNIEFFHKKQVYIAAGTVVASVVNIVLNLLLLPVFGYVAAAYATLVGYIVLFIMHFVIVKLMGKSGWYDTKFNMGFLGLYLVLIPVFLLIYKLPVLRYCLYALIAVTVIWGVLYFRKEIVYFLKKKSLKAFKEKLGKKA